MDWNSFERRSQTAVASARASSKGMGREHLVPGAIITLSPNLCTGDRSYSHEVYEVLARNEGHVVIKQRIGEPPSHFKGPHCISIHEHEFYPAEHLTTAMAASM